MNQTRRLVTSFVLLLVSALWGCGDAHEDPNDGVDIPEGPGAEEMPADQVESIDFHDIVEHDEALELEAPVGDIGTLAQPIFMPAGFGSEQDQTRCDGSWSGSECIVPDNRTVSFKVKTTGAEACGATIAAAAKLAVDFVIGVANSSPNSWTVTRVEDVAGQPANWEIKCRTNGSPGVTSFDFSTVDNHSTDRGTLRQVQGGNIHIGTKSVTELPAFINGTTAQRNRVWNNIVRHEVGHAIGFGHKKDAPFSQLMRVAMPQAPVAGSDDAWDNLLVFDADEKHMLDCYREGSPTGSLC